jgi:hypothetical protein
MSSRGPLIFRLELPLRLAPTLNAYAATKARKWAMAKLNAEVDTAIMVAKTRWPHWRMAGLVIFQKHRIDKRGKLRITERRTGGRRRLVVVHRHSSREPDEVSCDAGGGKLPLDRLKQAEVIRDDSRKWLAREAHWMRSAPGEGRVVVEVYELEGVG